ncbi:MAG: hypothetical protein JXA33_02730 [Anaerolineae bacterium]|nr:hypothetical protein [Anaerolineae bacterium]
MPLSYVTYDLYDGYIHNWLVAGPHVLPIQISEHTDADTLKRTIFQQHYEPDSGIIQQPVERGPLTEGTFTLGDYKGNWNYTRCQDDHFVDLTAVYAAPSYVQAWAYTQVRCPQSQTATFVLTSLGPADVWINGQHTYHHEGLERQNIFFSVTLNEGANEILVRFEQVTAPLGYMHAIALRLCQSVAPQIPIKGINVQIPTLIQDIVYRDILEQVFNAATLERDTYTQDTLITVRWPDHFKTKGDILVRLQTLTGRIYAESQLNPATGGEENHLSYAHQVPAGPLEIFMLPRLDLYYEHNVRLQRKMAIWNLGIQGYRPTPYATYAERRTEALQHAAMQMENINATGPFAEIAKMALGYWREVNEDAFRQTLAGIDRHKYGSVHSLLGLIGMLIRFGKHASFPTNLPQLLKTSILHFNYGCSADMLESERIIYYTCELLAGQLYPDQIFEVSEQNGQWHREHGERLALSWLHDRGAGGFATWDSNVAFATDMTALSHLIDLADSEALWELATVIMDKLLLTLALNSYQGVFGSTQGYAEAISIKGGLLAPTAGITRLLWGTGIYNHHIAGLVSMACMREYELPPLITEIALTPLEEFWGRERHITVLTDLADRNGSPGSLNSVKSVGNYQGMVNKVTYKTPDAMLSSAQDYQPGTPGSYEHIWQATLSAEAVVFANHPASTGETEAHAPGFWRGNSVLPRVAQWKDVLIAVHLLPDDDWMGYTHAYFPCYAFDAHILRENEHNVQWAFAQKGNGYLALAAARSFTLIKEGRNAYRELRSHGTHNVWVCHIGRAVLDGSFEAFQEKILALSVKFEDLAVQLPTLRGETLAFGWEGDFLRNGRPQPLANFKHYETPYCTAEHNAEQMEVKSDAYLMRLKLASYELRVTSSM